MTQTIRVECLRDRSWSIPTRKWEGETASVTLIDIATQSAEDDTDNLIPVGIVLLDDDTFECIPMEFMKKID